MVEMAKRDKAAAEDRGHAEMERANRAEAELKVLCDRLLEANTAKENYFNRACQLDDAKVELDRLRHIESDNGKLREQLRDMTQRIDSLNDKISDMDRANAGLKD